MYGEGDNQDKFVPFVLRSLLDNVPSLDLTEGEQKRDFIHVDDVAAAYVTVLLHMESQRYFQQYDVGSGSAIRIRDFVRLAKKVTGSTTVLKFGALPYRDHEIMESHADIRPLMALGWQPERGIKDSIQAIVRQLSGKSCSSQGKGV